MIHPLAHSPTRHLRLHGDSFQSCSPVRVTLLVSEVRLIIVNGIFPITVHRIRHHDET